MKVTTITKENVEGNILKARTGSIHRRAGNEYFADVSAYGALAGRALTSKKSRDWDWHRKTSAAGIKRITNKIFELIDLGYGKHLVSATYRWEEDETTGAHYCTKIHVVDRRGRTFGGSDSTPTYTLELAS